MAEVNWAGFIQNQQENQRQNDPINRFAQGFQIGATMRQQAALNAEREAKAKQEADLAARTQMVQDELTLNVSEADPYKQLQGLNQIMIKFPEISEKLKVQSTFLNDKVKENATNELLPALNALAMGNKQVAIDRLTKTAEAYKNSGNTRGAESLSSYIADIQGTENLAPMVQSGYMTLAGIIGPDKLMETLSKSQDFAKTQAVLPSAIIVEEEKGKQAPLETSIKQSEQIIKATDAKYAPTKAEMELEEKGWNIQKLRNDIDVSRQNARIAAMNAQFARESNDLKRQELGVKISEAQNKIDDTLRTKTAEIESARFNMDNMLNTAQRIVSTPKGVIESATGTISTRLPTVSQDTADFEALVENLGSQAFLSQIPNIKGMGALSNAEGEKLQQALQNFSLKQSPKQLLGNVQEAQRLILKARSNLADKYGVPNTSPDIPSMQTAIEAEKKRRGIK